ncbi:Uncharacterised protein [Mycoplasmopsis californica]|uniref:Lipoprotein 17-related variable surface protein n=1 Tax=Mycoplasmopsis equigenitalium TaxID=114883 RepID=A0ABY5J1K4_9BACT|nr:lipoprotein 17-related variable surface protein [Mycoplasmopsis equigenitalium]UUD36870.1 lipoprotein 17-related variable surface protein [Mycoplasmopsis equigenitalium]VEU69835.1 Uncharacterised protein [Mycoplasmopsis californica]
MIKNKIKKLLFIFFIPLILLAVFTFQKITNIKETVVTHSKYEMKKAETPNIEILASEHKGDLETIDKVLRDKMNLFIAEVYKISGKGSGNYVSAQTNEVKHFIYDPVHENDGTFLTNLTKSLTDLYTLPAATEIFNNITLDNPAVQKYISTNSEISKLNLNCTFKFKNIDRVDNLPFKDINKNKKYDNKTSFIKSNVEIFNGNVLIGIIKEIYVPIIKIRYYSDEEEAKKYCFEYVDADKEYENNYNIDSESTYLKTHIDKIIEIKNFIEQDNNNSFIYHIKPNFETQLDVFNYDFSGKDWFKNQDNLNKLISEDIDSRQTAFIFKTSSLVDTKEYTPHVSLETISADNIDTSLSFTLSYDDKNPSKVAYPWKTKPRKYTDKAFKFIYDNIYLNNTIVPEQNKSLNLHRLFANTNGNLSKFDTLPIWSTKDHITSSGWSLVYLNTVYNPVEYKDTKNWKLYFGNTPFDKYFDQNKLKVKINSITYNKNPKNCIFTFHLFYNNTQIKEDIIEVKNSVLDTFSNFNKNYTMPYLKIFKERETITQRGWHIKFRGKPEKIEGKGSHTLLLDENKKIITSEEGANNPSGIVNHTDGVADFFLNYQVQKSIFNTEEFFFPRRVYSYDKTDVNSVLDNLQFTYIEAIDFTKSDDTIKEAVLSNLKYSKIVDFNDQIEFVVTKEENKEINLILDKLIVDKVQEKLYVAINYKHSDGKTYYKIYNVDNQSKIITKIQNLCDNLTLKELEKNNFPVEYSDKNIKLLNWDLKDSDSYKYEFTDFTPDNVLGTISVKLKITWLDNDVYTLEKDFVLQGFMTYKKYVDEMVKNNNYKLSLLNEDTELNKDKLPSKNNVKGISADKWTLQIKNNTKSNVVSDDKFSLNLDGLTAEPDDLQGVISVKGLKLNLKYETLSGAVSVVSANELQPLEFTGFTFLQKVLDNQKFIMKTNTDVSNIFAAEATSDMFNNLKMEMEESNDPQLDKGLIETVSNDITLSNKNNEKAEVDIQIKVRYYYNGIDQSSVYIESTILEKISGFLTYQTYIDTMVKDNNYVINLLGDKAKLPSINGIKNNPNELTLTISNNPKSSVVPNENFSIVFDTFEVVNNDVEGTIEVLKLKLKLTYISGSVFSQLASVKFTGFTTLHKELEKATFEPMANAATDVFASEAETKHITVIVNNIPQLDPSLISSSLKITTRNNETGTIEVSANIKYTYDKKNKEFIERTCTGKITGFLTYQTYLDTLVTNQGKDLSIAVANETTLGERLPEGFLANELKLEIKDHDHHSLVNRMIKLSGGLNPTYNNLDGYVEFTDLKIVVGGARADLTQTIKIDGFDSYTKQFERFDMNLKFVDHDKFGTISVGNIDVIDTLPSLVEVNTNHELVFTNNGNTISNAPDYIVHEYEVTKQDDENGTIDVKLTFKHKNAIGTLTETKKVILSNFITTDQVNNQLKSISTNNFSNDTIKEKMPSSIVKEDFKKFYTTVDWVKKVEVEKTNIIYVNDEEGKIRYNVSIKKHGISHTMTVEKDMLTWKQYLRNEFNEYIFNNIRGKLGVTVKKDLIKPTYKANGIDILKPGVYPSTLEDNNNNNYLTFHIQGLKSSFNNISEINNAKHNEITLRIDKTDNTPVTENRPVWLDLQLSIKFTNPEDIQYGKVSVTIIITQDDISHARAELKTDLSFWSLNNEIETIKNKTKSFIFSSDSEKVDKALDIWKSYITPLKNKPSYTYFYQKVKKEYDKTSTMWYGKRDESVQKEIDIVFEKMEVAIDNATDAKVLEKEFGTLNQDAKTTIGKLKLDKNIADNELELKKLTEDYENKISELQGGPIIHHRKKEINFASAALLAIGLAGIIGSGVWLFFAVKNLKKTRKGV